MSVRQARWLLFAVLFLTVPIPIVTFQTTFVPAIGYVMIAAAGVAVALLEGAAGTVQLIIALYAAHAVVGTALCWGVAWGVVRGLPAQWRTGFVLAFSLVMLAASLALPLYETPEGRVPSGNLLAVLL